jgi:hypothetical protein
VNGEVIKQIEVRDQRTASTYQKLEKKVNAPCSLGAKLEAEKVSMSSEMNRDLMAHLTKRGKQAAAELQHLEDKLTSSTALIEKLMQRKNSCLMRSNSTGKGSSPRGTRLRYHVIGFETWKRN